MENTFVFGIGNSVHVKITIFAFLMTSLLLIVLYFRNEIAHSSFYPLQADVNGSSTNLGELPHLHVHRNGVDIG